MHALYSPACMCDQLVSSFLHSHQPSDYMYCLPYKQHVTSIQTLLPYNYISACTWSSQDNHMHNYHMINKYVQCIHVDFWNHKTFIGITWHMTVTPSPQYIRMHTRIVWHCTYLDTFDGLVHFVSLPILCDVCSTHHTHGGHVPPMNILHGIGYLPNGATGANCLDWQVQQVPLATLRTPCQSWQRWVDTALISGSAEFE